MENVKEMYNNLTVFSLSKGVFDYAKENGIELNADNTLFTIILFLRDNTTLSPSKIIEIANHANYLKKK